MTEGQTCSQSLIFSDCAIVGEDVQKVRVRGGGGGRGGLAPYISTHACGFHVDQIA